MENRRMSEMVTNFWLVKLLFLMVMVGLSGSSPTPVRDDQIEDYCSAHKFDKLKPGMRFTKELVTMEYADVGAFKALHCCLRGYRSIEWYKDGKAYPWPAAVSDFILYPESANQTIYTQETSLSDVGRYSCRARNDTHTITGEITLEIAGEYPNGYMGRPLATYMPVSTAVRLGEPARLFCEAYLGNVDLPDARNSVGWFKYHGDNEFIPSHGRVSQTRVSREGEHIIGSYLKIEATVEEDFDEYECRISNDDDEPLRLLAYIFRREPYFMFGMGSVTWTRALMFTAFGIVVIISIFAFYNRCSLPIAVVLHNKFGQLEDSDGKNFDTLVCYHENDASLVIDKLLPNLRTKNRYKCTTLQLSDLRRNWHLEITPHASIARRIIVIMSQNSLADDWTDVSVAATLKQLSTLSARLIVILNDLTTVATFTKSSDHCVDCVPFTDGIVLDKMTILRWKINSESDLGSYKFWCRLRLVLPPIRSSAKLSQRCEGLAMASHVRSISCPSMSPKTQSQESLQVLV